MFIGHALLAFALVAGAVGLAGWSRERATALGVVAAAFATAPDVDMAYALVGVWKTLAAMVAPTPDSAALVASFWKTGNLVHRAVTHSLVVAPVVALVAGLWVLGRQDRAPAGSTVRDETRNAWDDIRHARGEFSVTESVRQALTVSPRRYGLASLLVLAGLIAVAAVKSGVLGGAIMALFGLAVLAIAETVARRTDLTAPSVFGAALVGAASHPFGDLVTGEPPAFLYPLDATLVAERIHLSADPTLNLLGAFGFELAAIWLGVGTFLWLSGVSPRVALDRRATLGAGYAASAFVLPAPTLEVSYQFVVTVIAVGLVGFMPSVRLVAPPGGSRVDLPDGASAAVTGLAAVTLAGVAYAAAYVVF